MVYLALIYHMHQPYYRDRLTGRCSQPWVRLHGTKDYLDMLTLIREYPSLKATINLVPCLLEQVREYTECNCRDDYFELTLKPASSLTASDKTFLKSHFFAAHRDKVIALFPRYQELLKKYENGARFTTDDYRDLQLLFNLAWIDPVWRSSIKELSHLVDKAHDFSEKDKRTLLEQQVRILRRIIPAYTNARASGQVELTVSPFFHPILPLLYDTDTAKQAKPDSGVPQIRFTRPEDVRIQIQAAVDYFTATFGSPPDGMWPSEQSVSDPACQAIAAAGLRWIVTDEGILMKSLGNAGKAADRLSIYQPHTLETAGKKLRVIFRDRNLSDLIGFVYNKQAAPDAVNDFMRRLEYIDHDMAGKDALVTVALDGENAWEYYSNDGRDFLSLLYRRLCETPRIRTTTVSEYLAGHPDAPVLPQIAPGSWIFSEFSKWMDNPAKRKAWDALAQARALLDEVGPGLRPGAYTRALKQMHLCEGSDWFWWYGEDPSGTFDAMFRMHLSAFYAMINEPVPPELKKPISCAMGS